MSREELALLLLPKLDNKDLAMTLANIILENIEKIAFNSTPY